MTLMQPNRDKILIICLVFLSGMVVGSLLTFNLFHKDKEVHSLYTVTNVIDGDTIDVSLGSEIERVRLLGIDTPETVHPQKMVECYGTEASAETKQLLEGKMIYLIPDSMSSDRDKYGRLLRYVFLTDGVFVNGYLIKNGYAYNYIYEPFQFMKYFAFEEESARSRGIGLWGKCHAESVENLTDILGK